MSAPGQDTPTPSPEPNALENTLQEEIAKLRSAILRTITELDRFCMSVKRSREAVEEMTLMGERQQQDAPHDAAPQEHHHEQGEDKWYDTHADH